MAVIRDIFNNNGLVLFSGGFFLSLYIYEYEYIA